MTLYKYFLSAFILVYSTISFAQTGGKNYIGGSFGGTDFHIKDDHASPLIFSSIGIAPSLHYIHMGETARHFLEASYFSNYLSTSIDNFQTDNHRARIRYSFLHSVTSFKFFTGRLDLFIGGSAESYVCHSDYYYRWIQPNSRSRSFESWYWSSSLDLSVSFEYIAEEREFLSIGFFIPVLSNVSRPKFSTSADYNYVDNDWKFKMFGETKFFPENFSINTLVSYQHPLIWKFNWQISYEFYYSFYKKPNEVNMFMNNLRAGLFFCF